MSNINRVLATSILIATVCCGFVFTVEADLYEWGDVGTDWATPANWLVDGSVPATKPGTNDVAQFNSDISIANQPTISGDESILGLIIHDAYNADWEIGGSGSLTIGADGVAMTGQRETPSISPDIIINGAQTWYADAGDDRTYSLELTGAISGTGDLRLEERRGSDAAFTWALGDGTTRAPEDCSFDGDVAIAGTVVDYNIFDYDVGSQTSSTNFVFGGSIQSPGTISVDASIFRFEAEGGSSDLTIGFLNDFSFGSNGGRMDLFASGTTPTIDLKGDVLLGGPVALARNNVTPEPIYTGTWSLNQSKGSTCGLFVRNPGYSLYGYTFGGGLDDSTGDFANPLVMLTIQSDLDLTTPATNSTYSNGTVIDLCGFPYKTETLTARIDVSETSRLGVGDLTVLPGGKVKLGAATNMVDGQSALIQSQDACIGVMSVDYDGFPEIDPASSGVLGIDGTFSSDIDMSALGNGEMFLGTTDGGVFSGTSLLPGNDSTWRLGAGGGSNPSLTISGVNVLSGNNNLQVGRSGWHGTGSLILSKTNSFTGQIDVTGISMYNREPDVYRSGSTLQGYGLSGGSPFGDTNGVINLHNSTLQVTQSSSYPSSLHKAQLGFDGRSRFYLNCWGVATPMSFGELVRAERGFVTIYDQRGSFANNEQIHITNPPVETNGILPAWIVHERGATFVTYGANGLEDFAGYVTDITTSGANDVVNSGANTVDTTATCYALKNTSTISGDGTLSIGAGGLIMGGNISCNLDFGANEGLVYASSAYTISGDIAGTDGLTTCGNRLTISGAKTFSGQLTVNGCSLRGTFDSEGTAGSYGNTNNPIYLNGGALVAVSGDRLLPSRTITLGPGGGMISRYTVYSKITGSGMLMTGVGSYGGNLIIANPDNDYSGGTFLLSAAGDRTSGNLTATADGSLGTGDLAVGAYLSAQLQGDDNMDPGATVQVALGGQVSFESISPLIGGLVGGGDINLGTSGTSTDLSIGGTDKDSAFHGTICEEKGATACSVTKVGTGTFTLYGAHSYVGATTVEAGTFSLLGSIEGDLVVDEGAKLMGVVKEDGSACLGHVGGNIDFNGELVLEIPDGYNVPMGTTMTVLTCDGNITGKIDAEDGFRATVDNGEIKVTRAGGGTLLIIQ